MDISEANNGDIVPHSDGELVQTGPLEETSSLPINCDICEKKFSDPVILNCLHIFDRECLRAFEKEDNIVSYVKCPSCESISSGLKTLESYDISIANIESVDNHEETDSIIKCSVCTDGNEALYRCLHCAGTLCERCRDVHKVMKVFSAHKILVLTEDEKKNAKSLQKSMQNSKPVACAIHSDLTYTLFCMQCHVLICETCLDHDHRGHVTCVLDLVPEHIDTIIPNLLESCTTKEKELKDLSENLRTVLSDLSTSRDDNKNLILDTFGQWKSSIENVKGHLLQRNRELHDDIEMKIWARIHSVGKTVDHIEFAREFANTYLRNCSTIEMCKLMKNVLVFVDRLGNVPVNHDVLPRIQFTPVPLMSNDDLCRHFGSFNPCASNSSQRMPLFESFTSSNTASTDTCSLSLSNDLRRMDLKLGSLTDGLAPSGDTQTPDTLPSISPTQSHLSGRGSTGMENLHLVSTLGNGNVPSFVGQSSDPMNFSRPITNWSYTGLGMNNIDQPEYPSLPHLDSSLINTSYFQSDLPRSSMNPTQMSVFDMDSSMMLKNKNTVNFNATLYDYCRMRAARCSQMNLLTKWGSLGCELGRLNSPHGFCLGFDEEIVVADTYNHRIQIYTKRGDFISFFGVSGRVDGLLWYPRKVAIIRQSQRYVVCDRGNERSRMQLFSRSGHFVRRIPIRYIDIVAGLAINQHGHIVAIDSVTPSVFVVSEEGDLIRWFDCSNHMKEPSDVAIHGSEYYICDFKAHCVIVFQEDGAFLRRIGGETITDFPNGIDVSDHGDVLVGDSHGNRFHIAVFSRSGELLSEFVCNQTKVSRSCCLKITTEGYVVTLARSSNNVLVLDTLYIC